MKIVRAYTSDEIDAVRNLFQEYEQFLDKDVFAINMAKAMVHQMRSLFQANLKYPEEIDMPLHRLVREKLSG